MLKDRLNEGSIQHSSYSSALSKSVKGIRVAKSEEDDDK